MVDAMNAGGLLNPPGETPLVSARQKLNIAFLYGSLAIAGLAWIATGSPLVFLAVLVTLLVGNAYSRNIR